MFWLEQEAAERAFQDNTIEPFSAAELASIGYVDVPAAERFTFGAKRSSGFPHATCGREAARLSASKDAQLYCRQSSASCAVDQSHGYHCGMSTPEVDKGHVTVLQVQLPQRPGSRAVTILSW